MVTVVESFVPYWALTAETDKTAINTIETIIALALSFI